MMLLIALISAERGDVVRTVGILDRAYQARPQDPQTRGALIQLLTNVGEAMAGSGLQDTAAAQFEKALDLAEEAGSPEAAALRRRLAQAPPLTPYPHPASTRVEFLLGTLVA